MKIRVGGRTGFSGWKFSLVGKYVMAHTEAHFFIYLLKDIAPPVSQDGWVAYKNALASS